MLSIKRLIDLARLETGSYKEVANKLDTSGARITHWKNGRNEPTPFEIFRMAEIARIEPEKAFYEVMAEIDKDNASYWCARRDSNTRPSASETYRTQILVTFNYNIESLKLLIDNLKLLKVHTRTRLLITLSYIIKLGINLSNQQLRHIEHNLNERSASYFQYRHALANP